MTGGDDCHATPAKEQMGHIGVELCYAPRGS